MVVLVTKVKVTKTQPSLKVHDAVCRTSELLTYRQSVLSSNPIKGFHEQETLPSLLSARSRFELDFII